MDEIHLSEEEFTRQSLQNLDAIFPTETSCLSLFPAICRACRFVNETDERCFICAKCKTKTSRTAGTYFHGLRRLRPTIGLIWLLEDRAILSVNKFAEAFDIEYSTAWEMDKKMKAVLEKEMNKHDGFEVVSKIFDPAICKRSAQSCAGQHPIYEGDDDDDQQLDLEGKECMDSDQLAIYAALTSQPIEFDQLQQKSGLEIVRFASALAMLDLNEIAEKHAGNKFALKKTAPSQMVSSKEKETVYNFFAYAKKFHGVSRKYLQWYLAAFWTHWGKDRWTQLTLFETCLKYGRLRRVDLLAYHSPKMVRIPCY